MRSWRRSMLKKDPGETYTARTVTGVWVGGFYRLRGERQAKDKEAKLAVT